MLYKKNYNKTLAGLVVTPFPRLFIQGVPIKTVPLFLFCDNFRKCAPILTIFSLVEQDIYDA